MKKLEESLGSTSLAPKLHSLIDDQIGHQVTRLIILQTRNLTDMLIDVQIDISRMMKLEEIDDETS